MAIITKKLQNVNVAALKQLPFILTALLGSQSGIYVLYKKDTLYYIGKAVDLQRRLVQHLRDHHQKKWDTFSLFVVKNRKHIGDLESLLITICEPKGNKSHPRGEAQDLRKEFLTRIDEYHAKEKALILNSEPCKKKRNITLFRTYKGKKYTATYDCVNCSVRYNKIIYSSPSAAGYAITGKPCNGLLFWKVKNKKGKEMPLKKLI